MDRRRLERCCSVIEAAFEMTLPPWAKGTLLLVAAVVAGIVIGINIERRRLPAHDAGMGHMTHRLQEELGLDSAQEGKIAAILARHQGAVDSTWRELQPHV